MIRVLSVASECAPLVKTGGLADVVGALPAAMAAAGADMRVMLPAYPAVRAALDAAGATTIFGMEELFGGPMTLRAATLAGVEVIAVDAPHLYDRRAGPIWTRPGMTTRTTTPVSPRCAGPRRWWGPRARGTGCPT